MDNIYTDKAYELGASIARRGMQLWFGAGSTGLMGAVANGALDNGGEVVGVIPELFNTPALAHNRLTRLDVVDSMHQRKEKLAKEADAFIALPGGFGTFEEFFEILTWSQIGIHQKPIGLLNINHYYDLMLQMIENALKEGFIYKEHYQLFVVEKQVEAMLDALVVFTPPENLERWLTRET
jgi:uncharacterized protein (TIGR00730 family)